MSIERKIHNKRIEISISFVNALAIGSFAGGLIKPFIDKEPGTLIPFTYMNTGLLIFGVILHIFARMMADDLIEE